MERHLKIGVAMTVDDLVEKTTADGGVNMLRGLPAFQFIVKQDEKGRQVNPILIRIDFTVFLFRK